MGLNDDYSIPEIVTEETNDMSEIPSLYEDKYDIPSDAILVTGGYKRVYDDDYITVDYLETIVYTNSDSTANLVSIKFKVNRKTNKHYSFSQLDLKINGKRIRDSVPLGGPNNENVMAVLILSGDLKKARIKTKQDLKTMEFSLGFMYDFFTKAKSNKIIIQLD